MVLICTPTSGNNLALAQRLHALAGEQDLETRILNLEAAGLPLYSPQAEDSGVPDALAEVEALFAQAQGFVFCAPEYNGSIPPVLTSTIAWLSRTSDDFRGLFNTKPVALATHSGGGGQKVVIAMRLQFSHLGGNVIGRELLTSAKRPLNESSARAVLEQLAGLI